MKLLVPWGYFGAGNIGEDASLQGFARVVARAGSNFSVLSGSRNPRHAAKVEPSFRYFYHPAGNWRRRWNVLRTSAMVVVGSTPIMDVHGTWPLDEIVPLLQEGRRRGSRVAFVGSGTERLERAESRRIVAEELAPMVDFWTVRSQPDEARLREYGVSPERVCVAGDLAWMLEPVSPDWGCAQFRAWGLPEGRRIVGVNLMDEEPVRKRHPRLFETLAKFFDTLVERHEVTILFLLNDVHEAVGFDKSASLRTLAAMKRSDQARMAPLVYWSPQRMMSLIANCYVTMSMRYHFCLFSALQSVPFIALKRSDKVADICRDLEWPHGADFEGLSVDQLLTQFESLSAGHTAAAAHLSARLPALHARACENTNALEALNTRPH